MGPDRKTLEIGMLLVTIVGSCPKKCLDKSQAVFSNSLDTNRFRYSLFWEVLLILKGFSEERTITLKSALPPFRLLYLIQCYPLKVLCTYALRI